MTSSCHQILKLTNPNLEVKATKKLRQKSFRQAFAERKIVIYDIFSVALFRALKCLHSQAKKFPSR